MIDDFPFMLRVSKHFEPFFKQRVELSRPLAVDPTVSSSENFADVVF